MAVATTGSDLAPPEISNALRNKVKELFAANDLENLTVKRVRAMVEEELDLDAGFFKEDDWKGRSKEIIESEYDAQSAAPVMKPKDKKSAPSKETIGKTATSKKGKVAAEPKRGTKRPSPDIEPPKGRKKSKTAVSDSDVVEEEVHSQSSASDFSDDTPTPKRKNTKASTVERKEKTVPSGPAHKLGHDVEGAPNGVKVQATVEKVDDDELGISESEMSEVLDDEPPKKRKREKSSSAAPSKPAGAGKKAKKNRSETPKDDPGLDPDQAEIKRLQSWLLKCGIRKLWHKELAPYDTPSAKIRHLKNMLQDAGMTGRYSVEKARQIKEERELKAELEAVQEGAKLWGQSSDEEGKSGHPKRRLAKGFKDLDFLGDDGEETD